MSKLSSLYIRYGLSFLKSLYSPEALKFAPVIENSVAISFDNIPIFFVLVKNIGLFVIIFSYSFIAFGKLFVNSSLLIESLAIMQRPLT